MNPLLSGNPRIHPTWAATGGVARCGAGVIAAGYRLTEGSLGDAARDPLVEL